MLELYVRNGHIKWNITQATVPYVTLNTVKSGSTQVQVKSSNRKQEKDMRALRSVLPQDQLPSVSPTSSPPHFSLIPANSLFRCLWFPVLCLTGSLSPSRLYHSQARCFAFFLSL